MSRCGDFEGREVKTIISTRDLLCDLGFFEDADVYSDEPQKKTKLPFVVIEKRIGGEEAWVITHLLMPVHGKIRTTIVQLLQFGAAFGTFAHAALSVLGAERAPVSVSTRMSRGHAYIEELLTDAFTCSAQRRNCVFTSVRTSRYVGVTRMVMPTIGVYDVLVDTTGTARNAHCLGIVCRSERGQRSDEFATAFGKQFACPAIT